MAIHNGDKYENHIQIYQLRKTLILTTLHRLDGYTYLNCSTRIFVKFVGVLFFRKENIVVDVT